jgi:hypothetical protein
MKWFVVWYPEMHGWAVMKGDFRDSWFIQKHLAIQRRDALN